MSWARRIGNALRPGRVSREIDRELAFHLTEKIEELQAAGVSETESLRAAQRQIGNRTYQTERTRDMDINQRLEATLRNFRQGARGLLKAPGVHGDSDGDAGARHRGEQRRVFGDLGGGAEAAAVS